MISNNNTLWLLSYTIEGAKRTIEDYNLLNNNLSSKIDLNQIIINSDEGSAFDPAVFLSKKDIFAVLLVLEKEGLKNEKYNQCINNFCDLVSKKENFRLFVVLENIKFDELRQLTFDNKFDSLKELFDTVQISETDSSTLKSNILTYFDDLDNITKNMIYKRVKIFFNRIVGLSALYLEVMCIIITILAVLTTRFYDMSIINNLPNEYKSILALVSGMTYFLIISIIIYFVTNRSIYDVSKLDHLMLLIFSIFFLPAPAWMIDVVNASWIWFNLGIFGGIIIDLTRRNRINTRRILKKIDKTQITRKGYDLPKKIKESIYGNELNPLNVPMFPNTRPNIFISYTRSSEWSSKIADMIAQKLKESSTLYFLDRHDIREGSNWRRALNENLGESLVFISLIENNTISRSWPAAELETALYGKHLTGSPYIVILENDDITEDRINTALPVFESILKMPREAVNEFQPKIIQIKSSIKNPNKKFEQISQLVSSIQHYPGSVAVFESKFASLINLLILPLILILNSLASVASIVGIIGIFLIFLNYLNIIYVLSFISQYNLDIPIFLYFVYSTAYFVKIELNNKFEKMDIFNELETNATKLNIILSLAGLLFFIQHIVFTNGMNFFIIILAVFTWGLGWLVGENFIFNIWREKTNI